MVNKLKIVRKFEIHSVLLSVYLLLSVLNGGEGASHEYQLYSVTNGFTRFIMMTKYDYHDLISPCANIN